MREADDPMTLSVSAFERLPDGTFRSLRLESDLAGFERTRHSFFGARWARDLGLSLLPQLREQSELWVEAEDLSMLADEIAVLRRQVLDTEEESYWVFRLDNISKAIDAAGPSGAVCIS
jgi:hypothetical protein